MKFKRGEVMSSNFKNIEGVLKRADEIGNAPVLSYLKDLRSNLHPDKNGGTFSSEEEEEQYHFLNEAINQLEIRSQYENQLIPVAQLPTLIDAIGKTITTQHQPNPIDVKISCRESFRKDLSRKYFGPKIGSGIFAAVTAFLFTQSPNLIVHPLVGDFFKSQTGLLSLAMLFLVSVSLFILTWLKERFEEKILNYLLSEEALGHIYSIVEEHSNGGEIATNDIRAKIRSLCSRKNYTPISVFIRPRLSHANIDMILDVQLQKLIDRKVLELVDKPSIERVYRVVA